MKKYIIRDREAGNTIATFDSYEEAIKELENYEAKDAIRQAVSDIERG